MDVKRFQFNLPNPPFSVAILLIAILTTLTTTTVNRPARAIESSGAIYSCWGTSGLVLVGSGNFV